MPVPLREDDNGRGGFTRNALSRRATVYICDACGMQEALEDMMDSITPLTAWAIVAAPENWRMEEGGSECEA